VTFQEGLYLYGALAGVLALQLGVFALFRRKRMLNAFSRIHEQLDDSKRCGRHLAGTILVSAALVLAAIALAGPEGREKEVVAQRMGMDIVFCVDTSRSMLACHAEVSRLERARQEIRSFLDYAAGDRLGLVAFAGSARVICPLTHDLESFKSFVSGLDVYAAPGSRSSVSSGLLCAVDLVGKAGPRPRAVVLLSDGENTVKGSSAVEAARHAAATGIGVYALMLGSPEGAFIPLSGGVGFLKDSYGDHVVSRPDAGLLKRAASAGGGAFVAAQETAFPIDFLYAEHLSKAGERALDEGRVKGARPEYQGFLLAAMILLLLEFFLPFRRPRASMAVMLLVFLGSTRVHADEPAGMDAMRDGVRSYRSGEFESALASFDSASSELKGYPDLLVNQGLAHLKLGSFEEALALFECARSLGDGPAAASAAFGAGIAGFRLAEKALAAEEAPDCDEERANLSKGLGSARDARSCFVTCLKNGFWPDEAAADLDLVNRVRTGLEDRLLRIRGKDGKKAEDEGEGVETGEGSSSGEGKTGETQEGTRVGSGMEDRAGQAEKPGDGSGVDEDESAEQVPVPPRISAIEMERIFDMLEELEKRRIALRRAAIRAARLDKGGGGW